MMKIPIVLCGILCATSVHSIYHTVEESKELREVSNAMLDMTTAHITTIYGQYISWVEHIARERKEGIPARRHEDANLHYMSFMRRVLGKKLRKENIENVNHPNYTNCHKEQNNALCHIASHDRELKDCFEITYSKILVHEEPMKNTQRMILDRLTKLKSQLNGCALGKSNDDFYHCINSCTDEINLLYRFSIRDNVHLKIEGETMSMPPRASLDIDLCYNKIDTKYCGEGLARYERVRKCYAE